MPQIFLSTPSARRATTYFAGLPREMPISIHALREEGDAFMPSLTVSLALFLSTPSARRATGGALQRHTRQGYFYPRPPRGGRHSPCVAWEQGHSISIHVLREEGDSAPVLLGRLLHNFYPRPPRGGRLIAKVLAGRCAIFLSTPSARRATTGEFIDLIHKKISIHALREEGDTTEPDLTTISFDFYPRPPRGGRP